MSCQFFLNKERNNTKCPTNYPSGIHL